MATAECPTCPNVRELPHLKEGRFAAPCDACIERGNAILGWGEGAEEVVEVRE